MKKLQMLNASLAALALGTAGCISSYHRSSHGVHLTTKPSYVQPREKYVIPDATSNSTLGKFSHEQLKYTLENLILYETEVYAVTNTAHTERQLPFSLYTTTNTSRVIDTDLNILILKPEAIYVPEKIKNAKDQDAHKLTLSTTGRYAKGAILFKPNPQNIPFGVVSSTQDATQFQLEIQHIMSTEYYTIFVEEDKKNDPNALPFYFLPKEHTTIEIKPDGQLVLDSLKGIFRPKRLTPREYFLNRTETLPPPGKGASVISVE